MAPQGVLAAVALVLVAALVVAGGGWCFAGEVDRQALAIDPGSSQRRPVLDLTVTGSGDGRVAEQVASWRYGVDFDAVDHVPGAGHVRSWNADPPAYERVEAQLLAEVAP